MFGDTPKLTGGVLMSAMCKLRQEAAALGHTQWRLKAHFVNPKLRDVMLKRYVHLGMDGVSDLLSIRSLLALPTLGGILDNLQAAPLEMSTFVERVQKTTKAVTLPQFSVKAATPAPKHEYAPPTPTPLQQRLHTKPVIQNTIHTQVVQEQTGSWTAGPEIIRQSPDPNFFTVTFPDTKEQVQVPRSQVPAHIQAVAGPPARALIQIPAGQMCFDCREGIVKDGGRQHLALERPFNGEKKSDSMQAGWNTHTHTHRPGAFCLASDCTRRFPV